MAFADLATTQAERSAEFRRRSRAYEERTITPGAVADFEPDGWEVVRQTDKSVRIRRSRKPDEVLENRFWCCLYRLGYVELNCGRYFKIPIGDGVASKQIDVFAKDDETIVVAECKTAEQLKKKSLQKDLGEFHANKKFIADSIRKNYPKDYKPKIIWLFIIENISLSREDVARAKEYQISIINTRELLYFEEIAKALEGAARQQFKAEYLAGQKIPALEDRKVPATRIKLGGKTSYVFTAKASDVLKRAFVNHRDLRDPASAPTYQRLVKPNRLAKIRDFLDEGGFFPNSILLSFQKKPRFDHVQMGDDDDIKFGYLYLPETYKSMRVVDGQHRLYGCAVMKNIKQEPSLVFIAIDGIGATEEALLFTTINKEQQRVQKKLIDALEGDLNWESDNIKDRIGSIASRALDLMNAEYGAPFEDKIPSPGIAAADDRPLTLPELKKAIVSADLIGRVSSQGIINPPGPCFVAEKGQFDALKTLYRLIDALNWYFSLIRNADRPRWDAGREGRICNNFGIPGHLRLLGEICRHIEKTDGVTLSEVDLKKLCELVQPYVDPVTEFIATAGSEEIERRFAVKLGSGGIKQYYFALSQIVNAKLPAFLPAGFQEWKSDLSKEQRDRADQEARWIQENVHGFVLDQLRKLHGDKFFDVGISNNQIKLDAHRKRMESPAEDGGPEKFLDFLDLKKIVEQKENWSTFEKSMGIRLPDQKKGLAKYIQWYDEVNRIRRISAHPFQRAYSDKDIEILSVVREHLKEEFEREGVGRGV